MVERCLIAASLAALVCHPSSTIKCFKPKPRPRSPQKQKPEDPFCFSTKGFKTTWCCNWKGSAFKTQGKTMPQGSFFFFICKQVQKEHKDKPKNPLT
ncbi:hypothetical protein GBA52_014496 [Prunus armeniaca]|nr:hypothetical protein GBA52_014496 [Prunus armeniaca]